MLGGWPNRNADHSAALASLIEISLIVPPAIKCCGGVLGGWPNGLGVLEAGGGMWEGWSDGLGAAAVVTRNESNGLGAAAVVTRNEVKSPSSRRV